MFHAASNFPVVDNWTTSPVNEHDSQSVQNVQNSEQPPPYSEVVQNGHVSLMHGYSMQTYKPEEVSDQSVDLTAQELSLLETSHGYDPTLLSHEGNQEPTHYSPVRVNHLSHSLDAVGSQALFRPVRASSPLPGINHSSERTFPVRRPRSRSIDFAPLHPLETGEPMVSFPTRPSLPSLPQTVTTFNATDDQITSREVPGNLFPARPRERLPPLQHQFSQPAMYDNVHITRRTSGDVQIRTRRKKRKRMHTWHGERVAPRAAPVILQDASNTSPVEE